MGMTYGELARLEQQLVDMGAVVGLDDVEPVLRDIAAFYSELAENDTAILDSTDFATLCEHVRCDGESRKRKLALGALVLLTREGETNPGNVKFAARFAVQRIQVLTGHAPLWSGIEITDSDRENADALFEAARGDESYSDEELSEATQEYVDEHSGEGGLFGRLASDLSYLVDVVQGRDEDILRKETARAALTYYAVIADAIPDDLGLVGLIDDIYIVNRAVRELRPERGALTGFLDTVLSHWPFVSRLTFRANGTGHPLSEYMVVNAALLLEAVRKEDSGFGAAVVVSDVGPVSFLIGFVRAIAEVAAHVSREAHPAFKFGEKLVNRGTKKEIEFRFYGRLIGSTFVQCPADEADYFQFVEIKSKKHGGKTVCLRKVKDVYCFTRKSKDQQGKKRGELVLDPAKLSVGPLERLLGTTNPIELPIKRGRVVVVAQLGTAKELAKTLTLYGMPLSEVIPMGATVLDGDGFEFTSWTGSGAGGSPMLTVVPRTADAVELAEDLDANIVAVISPIKQDSTDAMNLSRIANEGIPVIAFVEESDIKTHDQLEKENFNFWAWDNAWYSVLHWPVSEFSESHPIGLLERSIRNRLDSTVQTVPLQLIGLSEASQGLESLEQWADENENEQIGLFLEETYRFFLGICRQLAPVTAEWANTIRSGLTKRNRILDRQTQWWSEEEMTIAKDVLQNMEQALGELEIRNPKFEMLLGWSRGKDSGSVVCSGAMRGFLEGCLHNDCITLGGVPKGSYLQSAAVIPAWLGRNRMGRLLSPPIATITTLALYEPEMEWYKSWRRRTNQYNQRFRQIAANKSPFPNLKSIPADLPREKIVIPPSSVCPDEIVLKARRRRVLAGFKDDDSVLVKARLIHFAGGSWAAFLPKHELPTLTNLVGVDADNLSEDDYIKLRAVETLESGELILLMRGSGHDAIRAVVDLDPQVALLREAASQWQSALKRYVEKGHSIVSLRQNLGQFNCHRSEPTIRRWLESERIIGPRHGLSDIKAIQQATGDTQLKDNMQTCFDAVSKVRSLHMTAAKSLTEKVLDRAVQWLDAGAEPDELVEIEDSLVLAAIDSVDTIPIEVPRRLVNRIQEEQWLG